MIERAVLSVVRMPMRNPFAHAKAVRTVAESVFLSVTVDGITGIGECVPRDYVTGETVDSVCAAILHLDYRDISGRLRCGTFEDAGRAIEALDLPARMGGHVRMPAAACALELALLDAFGKRFGQPLSDLPRIFGLPADLLRSVDKPLRVTRVLDLAEAADAPTAVGRRTRHIKVKVGKDLAAAERALARLRETVGGSVSISVDANMAWSFDEAVRATVAFAPFDIAWYEEPLADNGYPELRRFRQVTAEKVMLDEALSGIDDARRSLDQRAADLINIRLSKCGGFIASLRLAEFAWNNGLGFQIGVQVGEMGPLWAAGRHFGSAVDGAASYEAGRGDILFAEPLITPQPPIDRNTLIASALPGPGLGVSFTPAARLHAVRRHEWTAAGNSWRSEGLLVAAG